VEVHLKTTALDLMAYCPMRYLTVEAGHREENDNKKRQSIGQAAHESQLENYQKFLPKC
jgi:hypothetical protein